MAQASLWMGAIAGSLFTLSFHPVSATPETQSSIHQSAEVNREAVLAIALGGSAAIGIGLSAAVNRNGNRKPSAQPDRFAAVSFDRVSRPLQQKLVRALHGDRPAAQRLFTQASFKTPGKSSDWYAEKVIYDLERDRGK
ncbi:hypothetical protein [Microcoleus sp. FACHB-1515]|uniref:hypothetical protein n=1 Tax=Microcoleus sp. FACHB-1515 TaxID=2692821 RepID=UPI001A7EB2E5|nr:hypothetical protein [Microcoleus sp. FACHB-1515]